MRSTNATSENSGVSRFSLRARLASVAGVLTVLVATSFLVVTSAGASTPPRTVHQSAPTTVTVDTAQVTFRSSTVVSLGASPMTISVSGSGAVDLAAQTAQFSVTSQGGPIPGTSTTQLIVTGSTLYLQNPALSGGSSTQWKSVSLDGAVTGAAAAAHRSGGSPACSPATGSTSANTVGGTAGALAPITLDPTTVLNYLQQVSGPVTNLGSASIGGTPTTEYAATIDLSKVLSKNTKADQCAAALLKKYTTLTSVPVDVWIDSSGLVRQVSVDVSFSVTVMSFTVPVHESLTVGLSGFGDPVDVNAPPAADVTPLQLPAL